jgi:hypothetical protein
MSPTADTVRVALLGIAVAVGREDSVRRHVRRVELPQIFNRGIAGKRVTGALNRSRTDNIEDVLASDVDVTVELVAASGP